MPIPIPCPKCGRELKLPDRSLLGRKGKCPKCNHVFILEEPPIVSLEVANPDPVAPLVQSSSGPEMVAPAVTPAIPLKNAPPTSEAARPGWMSAKPALSKPEPSPFANLGEVQAAPPPIAITQPSAAVLQASATTPAFHSLDPLTELEGTSARLKKLHQKNARRRNIGLAVVGLICVVVAAVATFLPRSSTLDPTPADAVQTAETRNDEDASLHSTATENSPIASPTHGKPIDLQYIPFGAQVVLNLHPAELWKQNSLEEEVRYCVPPIAKLIESTLQDLFQRKPEQVEELLICLIPGPRGSMPDIAAVAHLIEDQKRSQLIEQFGQRNDTYGEPVYISSERAYLIVDQKTLAVCPKSQVQEMVQAMKERLTSELIEPLLPFTDRDRHITAIFLPSTLELQETWFPENVRAFLRNSLEWLGKDVETVSWSFHLKDDQFYSEILLHNAGASFKDKGAGAKKLEKSFKQKLDQLAEQLVPVFQQMNPREAGKRIVIGRIPAMVEVFAMATTTDHSPQHVQIVTALPDRAAPNLALGTLLAWDESTRTDFTKERVKPAVTDGPKVPDLVADRLNMKIDVDFRRTPFNEAFAYIAGEINTPIDIDGDALKLGGFTKNIAQVFKLDATPTRDVIRKIFEDSKGVDPKPEKTLVIIVNESKKSILVTTLAVANDKGLKPHPL